MNMSAICLESSQIAKASEVLAASFYGDPLFRYLTPDSELARLNALKWLFKIALEYSQPYKQIYTTDEMKGVAVWLPPGQLSSRNFRLLQIALSALPDALLLLGWRRIGRFLSVVFAKHEISEPHWHLMLLGVSPTSQGQGIGSLLLQPIFKQAEAEGLPCYVETLTEQAVRFYQKNGFEVASLTKFPGTNIPLWTLKREPYRRG